MIESTITERLALIEPNWADVTRRSQHLRKQTLRRQGLLVLGGVLAAAVLAGGAYAVASAFEGSTPPQPVSNLVQKWNTALAP